ncbi:hypothetical protein CFR77_11500 [Komagataeibacter sucrofermentans]|uniref:Uncharacterized protein n=1 Tax=Komagataeibacter sucrofermentans TaxID=1053551 RepID=A0A318QM17_9PROT|nr:hypothetical protein CFR77_11500 [Komagataeibacter sucrofermentans]
MLILFEILSREMDRPRYGKFQAFAGSDAQIWAFDGLLAALEHVLSEPFSHDYDRLLSEAANALIRRRGRIEPEW